MDQRTVMTPKRLKLLDMLTKVSWRRNGRSDDDHQTEITTLPGYHFAVFLRKKEKPEQMYMKKVRLGSEWFCLKCDTETQAIRVKHISVKGVVPHKVRYQDVLFCPVCEEEPSYIGNPIYY